MSAVDRLTVVRALLLRADLARAGGDTAAQLAAMRAAAVHLEVAIGEVAGELGSLTPALTESVRIVQREGPAGLLRVIEGGRK